MPDVRRPTPRTHTVRPGLGRGGLALLLALAVTPYLNTLRNDLVYDDRALVTENQQVRTLDPRSLLHPSLDRYAVEWYRPLTIYSLAITYALGGLDPIAYHVGNLLSHAASVWLLSGIALAVLRRRAPALIAAALFAVHAIHVEAVAPASGRADLLSALFVLLTWRLALNAGRRPTPGRGAMAGAAAFAGVLAKESAIVAWPAALGGFRPVFSNLAARSAGVTEAPGAAPALGWSGPSQPRRVGAGCGGPPPLAGRTALRVVRVASTRPPSQSTDNCWIPSRACWHGDGPRRMTDRPGGGATDQSADR